MAAAQPGAPPRARRIENVRVAVQGNPNILLVRPLRQKLRGNKEIATSLQYCLLTEPHLRARPVVVEESRARAHRLPFRIASGQCRTVIGRAARQWLAAVSGPGCRPRRFSAGGGRWGPEYFARPGRRRDCRHSQQPDEYLPKSRRHDIYVPACLTQLLANLQDTPQANSTAGCRTAGGSETPRLPPPRPNHPGRAAPIATRSSRAAQPLRFVKRTRARVRGRRIWAVSWKRQGTH